MTTGTTASFCCTPTRKYIDVMERTLYNGLISGVSLDGKSFFYPNPLESNRAARAQPLVWRRVLPWQHHALSRLGAWLRVRAPGGHDFREPLCEGHRGYQACRTAATVKLTQETRYPWDGAVRITVMPEQPGPFALKIRIPGWARDEVVPSDLYRFADTNPELVAMRVNGRQVSRGPHKRLFGRAARMGERRCRRVGAPDARATRGRQRQGRGRPWPGGASARANRVRRRMAGQPEWQGTKHRAAPSTHR